MVETDTRVDLQTSDELPARPGRDDFESLFRLAPEPYLVTDQRGAIREANDAACAFLQTRRQALIGRPVASLATVQSRRRLQQLLPDLSPGDLVREQLELQTAIDEPRTCRAALVLALTPQRTPQVLWLLEDMTHEVEAQAATRRLNADLERKVRERTAELEATLERLQVALRHKDEFLSMMSHELRTPLTVMLGGTRFLAAKLDLIPAEDRTAMLGDMVRDGERLQHLIENLMLLARVNNAATLELEPVMLQRLIPAALTTLTSQSQSPPISVDIPDDLPPALGSPANVEHVITNLLANSLKYAPAGACIDVTARRVLGHVVTSVRDYGLGLEPDDARHIFEPFYRSRTVQERTPGDCIGLTVCKQLIEAQGGRIWSHRPAAGTGTVFSFALRQAGAEEA